MNTHELESMAKLRCADLSDSTIQLAYLIAEKQWDKAAEYCLLHARTLNLLAGCVANLLPNSKAPDAPKEAA